MKSLMLCAPHAITSITSIAGPNASDPGSPAANLLRPDPREAFFQSGGGFCYIDIDFGAPRLVDTFFLGYVANANAYLNVYGGTATSSDALYGSASLSATQLDDPLYRHLLVTLDTPQTARYVRFRVNSQTTAAMSIGCLAAGRRFTAQWGTEWGSGRMVTDTGTAERLFGGGFGIDEGARVGGYSWTFGDLQPLEVERLYRVVRSVGLTRPILVVEDPDPTNPSLSESIHWGLLGKLDAYERLDPQNTKWALQVGDWA